ncbi:MAG TPA: ABC transporter permease [Haliangium sp.]|nr:ABC transporter permease [Haliangium sp.]
MHGLAVFSPDRWYEIFDTIRRNKLRTFLTALSVAWGIFMLVILLAAGNGLRNSVAHDFRDDAVNSLWIWAGQTSLPHEGHPIGRAVQFTNRDYQRIRDTVPGVERITGRFFLRGNLVVSRGSKNTSFDVRACHPDHRFLEKTVVTRGRFLDDIDQAERRKVAVIGADVARFLFEEDEDPLGHWITINNIQYLVIGLFEDEGGEDEQRKIYIPIATAQMAYGGADAIHQLMFTVGDASAEESKAIEAIVRDSLAEEHEFDPEDKRALRIRNNVQSFQDINAVFDAIELFVWFIGAGTIVAGIVGVSNIMLISVKERTKEIGVRKALGATAGAIVGQILQESIFLTAVAGYMGMVAGIGLIELFLRYAPEIDFMRNPEVDLRVVTIATVILVISGALAGYVPARRAARVDPVVALRDE